jgi:hypothetical protein
MSGKIFDDGGVVTPRILRATWTDVMLKHGGPSALSSGSYTRTHGYNYVRADRIPVKRRRKNARGENVSDNS